MTRAYALELLRIALDRTMSAARDVYAHNPPDWLCHRLTHITGECQSMRDALEQFAKDNETKGATE